jgi:hypothetical protein
MECLSELILNNKYFLAKSDEGDFRRYSIAARLLVWMGSVMADGFPLGSRCQKQGRDEDARASLPRAFRLLVALEKP